MRNRRLGVAMAAAITGVIAVCGCDASPPPTPSTSSSASAPSSDSPSPVTTRSPGWDSEEAAANAETVVRDYYAVVD